MTMPIETREPDIGEVVEPDLPWSVLVWNDANIDDPSLRRLFPTAYPDDAERDREYRQLVGDELVERRRAALDTLLATVDASSVSEDDLAAWMGAINDLRLVLGTRLDVSEE